MKDCCNGKGDAGGYDLAVIAAENPAEPAPITARS